MTSNRISSTPYSEAWAKDIQGGKNMELIRNELLGYGMDPVLSDYLAAIIMILLYRDRLCSSELYH